MVDKVELCIVVAMGRNRLIGRDNRLPWHLSNDLRHFKRITLGHPVIMGRRTFDSIGKPLPGRPNIVVTRQQEWRAAGVEVAHSLAQAQALAAAHCAALGVTRVMLIGGADLYRQALPECRRMFITEVSATLEGDAFFPEFALTAWREVARQTQPADALNPYEHAFVELERR